MRLRGGERGSDYPGRAYQSEVYRVRCTVYVSVGIEKEGGRVYKNGEHHKHGGEQYSPGARGDTKKNRDTGRKMSRRGCIGPECLSRRQPCGNHLGRLLNIDNVSQAKHHETHAKYEASNPDHALCECCVDLRTQCVGH